MSGLAKAGRIAIRVVNILLIIAFVIILAFNILNVITMILSRDGTMPKAFGYAQNIIETGSMADAINAGDYVVISEQGSYKTGDVITFRQGTAHITHRIIEKTEHGFITKGDANGNADGEITPDQIEGKVVLNIPKLGGILRYLRTPLGMLFLVLGGALIFASPKIINMLINPKKEKKRQNNIFW